MWGAVLGIGRYLASLASIHSVPVVLPLPVLTNTNVPRHCHMSPGGQNHPQLRTIALTQFVCVLGSVLAVIDEIGERIHIHSEYKQMNLNHLPEVARYRFVISFVLTRNNLAGPKALQPMVSFTWRFGQKQAVDGMLIRLKWKGTPFSPAGPFFFPLLPRGSVVQVKNF